ncbi:MAG: diguanylate cyclase domain-containing protein [Gammaproteobacteria bacterium]
MNKEKPLVLVADDDVVIRELLQETLSGAGFDVITAEDGEQAIASFDKEHPDLALLDVVMPFRDGLQVCNHIRTSSRGEHMPILVITARTSLSMIHEAFRAGATDVLLKPINWTGLLQRLHALLRASDSLRRAQMSTARLRALLKAAPDLTLRLSLDGTILDVSASLTNSQANEPDNMLGMNITQIMPSETASGLQADIRRAFETGNDQRFHYSSQVNGQTRSFEIRLHPSVDNELIAIVRDVTERMAAQEALNQLIYADPLTGWVNRNVGMLQLQQLLHASKRRDRETAVMCLNIDHFQRVNDHFGPDLGDKVLLEVAQRLSDLLRHSDILSRPMDGPEHALDDRMGGDEFILVLADLTNTHENAPKVAKRVQEAIYRPFEIDGKTIKLTASIGVSQFPRDGDDALDLVRKASTAMKDAKRAGRDRVIYHSIEPTPIETIAPETQAETAPLSICFLPMMDSRFDQRVAYRLQGKNNESERSRINSESDFFAAMKALAAFETSNSGPSRYFLDLPDALLGNAEVAEAVSACLDDLKPNSIHLALGINESLLLKPVQETHAALQALNKQGIGLFLRDCVGGSITSMTNALFEYIELSEQTTAAMLDQDAMDELASTLAVCARHLNKKLIAGHIQEPELLGRCKKIGCDLTYGEVNSEVECVPSDT